MLEFNHLELMVITCALDLTIKSAGDAKRTGTPLGMAISLRNKIYPVLDSNAQAIVGPVAGGANGMGSAQDN